MNNTSDKPAGWPLPNPQDYKPTAPVVAELRYSIDLACAYLGISRTHLNDKIRAGEVSVIRDGRRVFVPGAEILRLSRAS